VNEQSEEPIKAINLESESLYRRLEKEEEEVRKKNKTAPHQNGTSKQEALE